MIHRIGAEHIGLTERGKEHHQPEEAQPQLRVPGDAAPRVAGELCRGCGLPPGGDAGPGDGAAEGFCAPCWCALSPYPAVAGPCLRGHHELA